MASTTMRRVTTRPDLREFATPRPAVSVAQLVTTLVPLMGLWWLTAELVATRAWWWGLVLCVVSTGLRTRAMLFQHDAGHRSLFRRAALNDAVGHVLGLFTWAPYLYWRRTHAMHHVNSSRLEGRDELGSITTLTVREYEALSEGKRFAYRLSRNPLMFCFVGGLFQFVIKHRYPWDMPRQWKAEWRSVWATNLSAALMFGALSWHFGVGTVLLVEFPILLLSAAAAVWLIFIQHVFEGGFFASGDDWALDDASLRGSSFYQLPAVLNWCTANVGFHHVHHFAPTIPNYRLHEAYAANPLFHVRPLTLSQSLGCWDLKLWDEEAGRFVGFPAPSHLPERSTPAT